MTCLSRLFVPRIIKFERLGDHLGGSETVSVKCNRVFRTLYKVDRNGKKDLTTAKKKLPAVGLDLMLQIITGLGVYFLTR